MLNNGAMIVTNIIAMIKYINGNNILIVVLILDEKVIESIFFTNSDDN